MKKNGGVQEWTIWRYWKYRRRLKAVSWVRIPPPPPIKRFLRKRLERNPIALVVGGVIYNESYNTTKEKDYNTVNVLT